ILTFWQPKRPPVITMITTIAAMNANTLRIKKAMHMMRKMKVTHTIIITHIMTMILQPLFLKASDLLKRRDSKNSLMG
ncbi:hypothetical protein QN363_20825, partial [Undibacterium sp. CCC2.1]|uniref:hypothetical protein n=1 Tax=Undibacterium sp. CCC2.1 TaxID=3048604 RepID=UPI002B22EC0B